MRFSSKHTERRAATPSDPKPHIDVMSAIKTATPTVVFSAISDAATTQQEINLARNQGGSGGSDEPPCLRTPLQKHEPPPDLERSDRLSRPLLSALSPIIQTGQNS